MFKQKRHYHVVYTSRGKNGCMTATTKVYFWKRVGVDHIKDWAGFASDECGHQAVITFFQRIAK